MNGELSELLKNTISNHFYNIQERTVEKTGYLLAKTSEEIDLEELYDFIKEINKRYKYISAVISLDNIDGSLKIDVEVEE